MRKVNSILIGLLFWSTTVQGTTIMPLTIEQRVAKADRVAVAIVESVNYIKSATQHRIYTVTKLRVLEPLKGSIKQGLSLTVRQIGGTIGEWTQHVPGDATFIAGQEVLVFLRHDPRDDLHFLVGMAQGKIDVDIAANKISQARPFERLPHRPTLKVRSTTISRDPLHLSSLLERIRRSLSPSP
ncbi:MAG: hypothetical protein ACPGQS_01965 [Bradymonadia bacterium]